MAEKDDPRPSRRAEAVRGAALETGAAPRAQPKGKPAANKRSTS